MHVKLPIAAAMVFFLSGCSLFPEPASLIQAPEFIPSSREQVEIPRQIAQSFLPAGSTATLPLKPVGIDAVLETDFNADGRKEILSFYKSTVNANKAGALLLKKSGMEWEKEAEIHGKGYDISYAAVIDLTVDGRPELLLGWAAGVSSGNILEIYQWRDGRLQKAKQLNYHKLEVIHEDGKPFLAIWQQELAEVYRVELWKWDKTAFVTDQSLHPSYFSKVADYYQKRTDEVPDVAVYWYFLADARLKADQPEAALKAINRGMKLEIVTLTTKEFAGLKKKIEEELIRRRNQDATYYSRHADLTFNIPRSVAEQISVEEREGLSSEYIIDIFINAGLQKKRLFSINIYAKEFVTDEVLSLPLLFETDHLLYTLERSEALVFERELQGGLALDAESLIEEITGSIRQGAVFPKHISMEDSLLISRVAEAQKKIIHIQTAVETGSFKVDGKTCRYLSNEWNSFEELESYLAVFFTKEAISSFIARTGIIEHNGKLAWSRKTGDSSLNYSRAAIMGVKDLGPEKQYDLQVPIANSLAYDTIRIVFKKTEEGWRIASNPLIL